MSNLTLTFEWACNQILVYEGSKYTNDPDDPGGATKWGITLGDYRLHSNPHGQPQDIMNLSREEAIRIYKKHYWDAVSGDQLPFYMAFEVFDFGVNSGIGRSVPFAGNIIGASNTRKVDADFVAKAVAFDTDSFIDQYHEAKLAAYRTFKSSWKYLPGWTSRANQTKALAKSIVMQFGTAKMDAVFVSDEFKNILSEGEIDINVSEVVPATTSKKKLVPAS